MAIMLDLKLDLLKVQEMISKCFIWKMNLHLSLTHGGFFFYLNIFFFFCVFLFHVMTCLLGLTSQIRGPVFKDFLISFGSHW